MDTYQALRKKVLAEIVSNIPKAFWQDAETRIRQAYADIYHQVFLDPNTVPVQKIDKLLQDRHFLMEHIFFNFAKTHGFSCSPTILVQNNRAHVYATKGQMAITQAYIPYMDAMPQPARYRGRYAKVNRIPKEPRFFGLDEPAEVLLGKLFYGILTHNPAGKKFTEAEQRLGSLQFCVPDRNCKTWLLQITVQEIIAEYPVEKPAGQPERKPLWKKDEKKGDGKA